MRQVLLHRTELRVSRLSFGTASLHHLPSSRRRQDVLAASFDNGFTHFDTAPSYGYGIAEQELGRFLGRHRGRVSIATKIGLYAPPGARPNTVSVWFRKGAGRVFPRCSSLIVDWSVKAASQSLDTSLRRLNTEQIDLLLLHEPEYGAIASEAVLDWLEQEQSKGKVRTWGLAGDADRMGPLLSDDRLASVLQVRDSLDRREADTVTARGRDLQITYGYLSASRAIASPLGTIATLRMAMQRNRTGSIVVSSRDRARVSQLARTAEAADVDATGQLP